MADIWMDVDTALSEVPVNILPLTDDGDFKSIEASVVYNAAGMDLVWNFVTTAGAYTQTAVTPTTGSYHDWTNQGDGMYSIEIPVGSPGDIFNDTEGFGWFTGVATGILPWRGPIVGFRLNTINDAFIDSDTLIDNADNALLYESAITTVTGQTEFIMTVAFAVDDSWIGNIVSLEDISTGEIYSGNIWISDSVQSTESLHINTAFPVTVVTGDKIRIYAQQHPTYAITTYAPAQVGAAMDLVADAVDATSLADDAITSAKIAASATTEIAQGTWAEVLGNTTMSASALVQIIAGVSAGKLSGAATTTVTIRDIEDNANLIVATVDGDGNRSSITITTPSD